MKFKNIALAIGLFAAMFSCSMEDDVLSEVGGSQSLSDAKVYVAIKAAFPSESMTKTVSEKGKENPTDAERKIDHCSLIFADSEGKILSVDDNVYVNGSSDLVATSPDSEDRITYMVKVGKKYKVMIVANSSQTFASCNSLTDVEELVQDGFPGSLVKVGREEIDLAGVEGYTSTTESAKNPISVSVTLEQLAARIELAGFTVKKFLNGTLSANVVINSVEVANINRKSYLTEEGKFGVSDYISESKSFEGGVEVYSAEKENLDQMYSFVDNKNVLTFYSYRNNATSDSGKLLSMTIHYTVGGASKTSKAFVINGTESGGTGQINSNTIYRLYVTAKVTSDDLLLDNILCYVVDWKSETVNVGNLTEEETE